MSEAQEHLARSTRSMAQFRSMRSPRARPKLTEAERVVRRNPPIAPEVARAERAQLLDETTAKLAALSPANYLSSEDQIQQREYEVMALLKAAAPLDRIRSHCKATFNIGRDASDRIVHKIRAQWRTEFEAERGTARAAAVNRLRTDLTHMRREAAGVRDYAAITRHEALLAKMEGTMQPVAIAVLDANAEMKDAMTKVLGELNQDDVVSFLAEGEAVERSLLAEGHSVGTDVTTPIPSARRDTGVP